MQCSPNLPRKITEPRQLLLNQYFQLRASTHPLIPALTDYKAIISTSSRSNKSKLNLPWCMCEEDVMGETRKGWCGELGWARRLYNREAHRYHYRRFGISHWLSCPNCEGASCRPPLVGESRAAARSPPLDAIDAVSTWSTNASMSLKSRFQASLSLTFNSKMKMGLDSEVFTQALRNNDVHIHSLTHIFRARRAHKRAIAIARVSAAKLLRKVYLHRMGITCTLMVASSWYFEYRPIRA